ncbi:hypothetical protein V2J09_015739 [Rumex salicifolius]
MASVTTPFRCADVPIIKILFGLNTFLFEESAYGLCVGVQLYFSTPKLQRDWITTAKSQTKCAISQPQIFKNGDCLESSESSRLPLLKSITSTSNPFIKHCVKLRQSSSYRHSHGSALVVGSTPIREICQFDALYNERSKLIECLILLDGAEVPQGLDYVLPVNTIGVNSMVMRKLSGVQSTESIDTIALMRFPSSYVHLNNDEQVEEDCNGWFPCCHRILVLEGIQDPGNLGTLLRSALAFKWSGVFLLDGCCDPFNEKALRASRGAAFQLPIVSGNWVHLEAFRNHYQLKMFAGHPHCVDPLKPSVTLSQSLVNSLSETPLCLVLGSEGKGISEKSKKTCELVSIPMSPNFESLNVSVAGGIFMFMMQTDLQGF